MEACQIYPFSHCGMFGGGGSTGRFSEVPLVQKQRQGYSSMCVGELREYLTEQHSRGEWFLPPALEPEQQSRSAFNLQPSQHSGGKLPLLHALHNDLLSYICNLQNRTIVI